MASLTENTVRGGGASSSTLAEVTDPVIYDCPYTVRKDGSLTHEHFQLRECRIVAGLRLDGLSDDEIVALAKRDNIFQYPTQTQIGNIAWSMLNRLDALCDEGLVDLLAHGFPEQAAQVNLYAMMRVYAVVRELLVDEVASHYRTLDYEFTREDMNAFITRYQAENASAATWSESTVKRIRSALVEILVSAGYLESNRSIDLLRVFLDPDLEDVMVRNGDGSWLPAFNRMEVA